MLASDLIRTLEKRIEEYSDLKVAISDNDMDMQYYTSDLEVNVCRLDLDDETVFLIEQENEMYLKSMNRIVNDNKEMLNGISFMGTTNKNKF